MRTLYVLGFGPNLVSVIIIVVLGIIWRNASVGYSRDAGMSRLEVILFSVLPAVGACLSMYDIVLLLKKAFQEQITLYHQWTFRCSQFSVWAVIMLHWKYDYWCSIFCNRVLCFWWIAKYLFEFPHLVMVFSLPEVIRWLKESFSTLVVIFFGVFLNTVRVMKNSNGSRKLELLEDPLISSKIELEECSVGDFTGIFRSFWCHLTFKSINSVMDIGVMKQLGYDDLIQPPIELNTSSCYNALLESWVAEQRDHKTHPSLFRAICYAYGWQYMYLGLLKVVNDCLGFVGPLLLNRLIWFLQQGSGHLDGYVLAISLGLTSIIKSFMDTQYTFLLAKLKLKLRSSIMTIMYHKCLSISLAERSKFSEGEIQTFMSVDADRTVNLFNSFHDMWSLPLQIGVALYLLYTQVKFAFLSGITITVLLIPVNKWLSTLIARATEEMMKQKDERIRKAGELLTYIRTLKMYGWELLFADRLRVARSLEVKYLSTRKYLDAWCVFFWATTPTLFSLFTFGLFVLTGHSLNAATVFTCLSLFNTLISPLNSFPWVINGLIDAIISTRRLAKFLSCPEHNSQRVLTADPSSKFLFNPLVDINFDHMAVIIRDASCTWLNNNGEERSSVLNAITLDLPKGSLVVVIREVGSGKSSLLNSILGETRLVRGRIHSFGSIAYASQVPWILSGTVRDNILFGREYDAKRYTEVLQTCTLDVDISLMVGGDLAYIGEKGVNLSGGQKARLSLARAVYSGADIFMLDDVLSAVDTQVASWILYRAILGPLMNSQTRVLCTHNVQAVQSADMIVIMDKGEVKWAGSLAEYSISPHVVVSSFEESVVSASQFARQDSNIGVSLDRKYDVLLQGNTATAQDEPQEFIEAELRKEGKVELSVYKAYAEFSSWPVVIIICISAVLMQASRNGNDLWLSYWVDSVTGRHKANYSTSFYLVVLSVFCLLNSLLTLVRAFSFAFGGLRAAVQVHNDLLSKLISAPVNFFDRTPTGRLLNRLSSDLYMIDDSLPFLLNILLANLFGLVGIAAVLSYVQVIFLLLLLPLWYIYSKLQFYYRATSRELRRLDSVSRSPIYTSFTETLDGSSTIRAFKAEDYFLGRFMDHIALYQKTSYSELIASLWLSLRLQLLAAFIISFVALMAVLGSRGHFPIGLGTPGLVGLALSYTAPIVSLLSSFLSSFTETEKEMVSVERVLQYKDVPEEEFQGCKPLHKDWPFLGKIEFQNVTLRYLPSSPPALRGITFTIAGGTQVGVIGRTGAGKSSVINALFRLNSMWRDCSGDTDTPKKLNFLLTCVRFTLFLWINKDFNLRDNIDPYGLASDSKIWEALEKCHVKDEVEAAGGLDIHVLCLDECTANVDTQTAKLLQNAISSETKGRTVITIAHRISTVMNMDKILILDQGNLVEEGNPQILLQDEFSRFSSFAKASTM
ncbi:hypothetical protein C5167_003644 [Papaver somniferum]|uniref:ABC-type xenobiotic transporter n=1 Tax=Papaver somniferum TaxID=3469 RepID=A0A4Y7L4V0_PAPSO|nr:hypothetical protein C5167_003644 [Papaver somniferum]